MKKVISINISGASFFIDEDAYEKLSGYLGKLKERFCENDEGEEIIADVETRLGELFAERINPKTGVITLEMVEDVIKIMGRPEDFSDNENDEKSSKYSIDNEGNTSRRRRLYRNADDRILGGVCAGIAAFFNIDPVIIRIIFAILPFVSFGVVIPIYIVLWIAVPAAVTTTQKMEMKGENITVDNIEKKIKEEYDDVKNRFNNFRKTKKTYRKSEEYVKKKMNERDRRILIIVAIVVLILIFGNISTRLPASMHILGLFPFTLFFPGFLHIVLILLILGLIFRSSFKVFLTVIIIITAVSIFIKTMSLIFGGVLFPLCW
jgi:phage shock protein PspC (stress-responsive transcriptional regulator)